MYKISVIIPNYNDDRIDRTIKSIIEQDYTNIELIIIDSCSTNEKVKDCYIKYRDKINHLIIEKDKGIFDALNKGIEVSSGDYIYLLGSDDYISSPYAFSNVINEFESNHNIDGVCINCDFFNESNEIVRKWNLNSNSKMNFKLGILPPHFSLFLSKDIYKKVGLFNLSFSTGVACDSEWLLRLGNVNPRINILPEYSTMMQVGGTSTGSLSNIFKGFKLTFSAAKNNGYILWPIIPFVKVLSKIRQFKLS